MRVKNNNGFSLLSFLIYLLLNSLLIWCIYSAVTTTILPSLASLTAYKKQIMMYTIADLFVKELRTTTPISWKLTSPTSMIWNDGEKDVCWRMNKKRIERVEGVYNRDTWQKKRISVVGADMYNALFKYDYNNGKIVGIGLTVSCSQLPKKKVFSYVAIR